METVTLIPHPEAPPKGVSAIAVDLSWRGGALTLTYRIAHAGSLKIPARHGRLDELWKTTCCEIFVREGAGPNYIEFNLAPDDAWAGYGFTGERQGMHNIAVADPRIVAQAGGGQFVLTATLAPGSLPANFGPASLSAVIEELDGTKSYWAIVHPKPEEFDFHDPRCFVLNLSPPPAA
jgi:hypothetical protein